VNNLRDLLSTGCDVYCIILHHSTTDLLWGRVLFCQVTLWVRTMMQVLNMCPVPLEANVFLH
jgi:hypothetical protein